MDSFFEDNTEQTHSLTKSDLLSDQKSRSEDKGRIEWLNEGFKMPKLRQIEEADKAYILGHRKRDLEKAFEVNTRAKFKIWDL